MGEGVHYGLVNDAGRWWFVDAHAERSISLGVTTVKFAQDKIRGTDRSPYGEANLRKYGSEPAWREAAARRLMDLGFNSLGAWSDRELAKVEHGGRRLAYMENADLGAAFVGHTDPGTHAWLKGRFPDVFDERWEPFCIEHARKRCGPLRDDPQLIGWFSDNELSWGPDWRHGDELLLQFLNLPADRAGAQAARAHLRDAYGGDWGAFERVWATGAGGWDEWASRAEHAPPFKRPPVWEQNGEVEKLAVKGDARRYSFVLDCESFLEKLAHRYFEATRRAFAAADPGRLNFGARFAYVPAPKVVTQCTRFVDGISFNCYMKDPRPAIASYAVFGKPMIIGEFSFRGRDSGLPNSKGAGPIVDTQKDRADCYEQYVTLAAAHPLLVGLHWFEHADEPKEGRFDGEDSNYGIVTIEDEPYVELQERMRSVNARLHAIHAAG